MFALIACLGRSGPVVGFVGWRAWLAVDGKCEAIGLSQCRMSTVPGSDAGDAGMLGCWDE
jgi:hypothetical protein